MRGGEGGGGGGGGQARGGVLVKGGVLLATPIKNQLNILFLNFFYINIISVNFKE